jgi:hypothetical protein
MRVRVHARKRLQERSAKGRTDLVQNSPLRPFVSKKIITVFCEGLRDVLVAPKIVDA